MPESIGHHWSSAPYPSRPFLLFDVIFQHQVALAVAEMMESATTAHHRMEKQDRILKPLPSIFHCCVWQTPLLQAPKTLIPFPYKPV